jgi:hypothetical protein
MYMNATYACKNAGCTGSTPVVGTNFLRGGASGYLCLPSQITLFASEKLSRRAFLRLRFGLCRGIFTVVKKLSSTGRPTRVSTALGVALSAMVCSLCILWAGCSDDAGGAPNQGVVSQGIPAGEFDAFANLIRNIDQAQAALDAAQAVGNPATIHERGVMLAQQQQILTRLYVDQHGPQTINRWIATVRAASTSASTMVERPPSMKELEEKFTKLGATLQTDSNGHITTLDCKNVILPEDAVKSLSQFKYLRSLNLSSTGITDKDLAQLKALKLLRILNLGRNSFKGPGLLNLKDMGNLERLSLNDTGLTDAAIPQLEAINHLKKISVLNLEGTALTTQGYEKITRLFRRADVRF